jgi:hypothetical protein
MSTLTILVLSTFKSIGYFPIYVNFVGYVIVSVIEIVRFKVRPVVLFLIVIFPAANVLLFMVYEPADATQFFVRNMQMVVFLFVTNHLVRVFESKAKVSFFLTTFASLVALSIVIEFAFFFPNPWFTRTIFGDIYFRIGGLVGEPNYMGLLAFVAFLIAVRFQKLLVAVFFICVILLTISRGALLGLAVFLVAGLPIFNKKGLALLHRVAIVMLCILPFIIFTILLSLSEMEDTLAFLNALSSNRIGVWAAYSTMIADNPFGVGLWQGQFKLAEYGHSVFNFEGEKQAHNFFLHIMADFGLLVYFLLCTLIIRCAFLLDSDNLKYLSSFLISIFFLNPLTAVSAYLFLSLIIHILDYQDLSKNNKLNF